MRKELLNAVQPAGLKPPPVIPPAKKLETQPPVKAPSHSKAPTNLAAVIKVIPEYRENGKSRLTLELVSADDQKVMPPLRVRPGMILKIIVMADPEASAAARRTNGGGNAKK